MTPRAGHINIIEISERKVCNKVSKGDPSLSLMSPSPASSSGTPDQVWQHFATIGKDQSKSIIRYNKKIRRC